MKGNQNTNLFATVTCKTEASTIEEAFTLANRFYDGFRAINIRPRKVIEKVDRLIFEATVEHSKAITHVVFRVTLSQDLVTERLKQEAQLSAKQKAISRNASKQAKQMPSNSDSNYTEEEQYRDSEPTAVSCEHGNS